MKNKSKKKILALCLSMILSLSMLSSCVKREESNVDVIETEPTPSISTEPKEPESTEANTSTNDKTVVSERLNDVNINLGNGLLITDIGSYTGLYMEDGTDDIVSGVLMMVVSNTSDTAIQYAEVKLPVGESEGKFTLSTLPAGKAVVLLEQNRMPYDTSIDYTTAIAENVVSFTEAMSLPEDKLKLQILDGAMNITNISDSNLSDDIWIYYKNSASDLYYGGITYRIKVEGGLDAGEIRQVMGNHLSKSGTAVMFVTMG